MRITSTAFQQMGEIPRRYTCDGEDLSPPLAWDGVPNEAKSLVLIVDDPDAPDPAAPKKTWVHWVVYDIPVSTQTLPEGVQAAALPEGAREGVNDFGGRTRYGGPCPPIGRHRYFHKLYAVDTTLGNRGAMSKADLVKAIEGHVLAATELVGTYQRAAARER
ncbi:MAG: YbhB/YbcL family Raf kinase inhibitor-like protein [Gemmatimonadaceae bacterium]